MNNHNTTSSQPGKNGFIKKILTGILFFTPVFAVIIVFLVWKNATDQSWLNYGLPVFLVLGIWGMAMWFYSCYRNLNDPAKQPPVQTFPLLRYLAVSGLCIILLECLGLFWTLLKPGEITGKGIWLWEAFFKILNNNSCIAGWGAFWIALLPILLITLIIILLVKALVKIIQD